MTEIIISIYAQHWVLAHIVHKKKKSKRGEAVVAHSTQHPTWEQIKQFHDSAAASINGMEWSDLKKHTQLQYSTCHNTRNTKWGSKGEMHCGAAGRKGWARLHQWERERGRKRGRKREREIRGGGGGKKERACEMMCNWRAITVQRTVSDRNGGAADMWGRTGIRRASN